MKNIMLKHCKKEYFICLNCNKPVIRGAEYLLLQDEKTDKASGAICQYCISQISKEQWLKWGFTGEER